MPTNNEWEIITTYSGGPKVAVDKLKKAGIIHWHNRNFGATNDLGFTALHGGCRPDSHFAGEGLEGLWWSSTSSYEIRSYGRTMSYEDSHLNTINCTINYGLSVRCIKD